MENELILNLKSGDEKALETIIERYSGYVLTVIRNFSSGVIPTEDMEEIASDVFYHLWKARANLDENGNLKAYIAAMARNAVKNMIRSGRYTQITALPDTDIPSPIDVSEIAELSIKVDCVYKGLNLLNNAEQEAFIRFYYFGEKISDISVCTKASESTTKVRLHRAREKLKAYLKERGFDDE